MTIVTYDCDEYVLHRKYLFLMAEEFILSVISENAGGRVPVPMTFRIEASPPRTSTAQGQGSEGKIIDQSVK